MKTLLFQRELEKAETLSFNNITGVEIDLEALIKSERAQYNSGQNMQNQNLNHLNKAVANLTLISQYFDRHSKAQDDLMRRHIEDEEKNSFDAKGNPDYLIWYEKLAW